jgi:hypothetical protein
LAFFAAAFFRFAHAAFIAVDIFALNSVAPVAPDPWSGRFAPPFRKGANDF